MLKTHMLRRVLGAGVAGLIMLVSSGTAQPTGDIILTVVGLASDEEEVRFGLYATADAFAFGRGPAVAAGACPVGHRRSVCRIPGVPYGVYAFLVGHDVNRDGQVSKNPLSDERKGASNYRQKFWTVPRFDAAKFVHQAEHTEVEVRVH